MPPWHCSTQKKRLRFGSGSFSEFRFQRVLGLTMPTFLIGGTFISPACPHCNAPELEVTHIMKGSETRRYEDSPAVQKKPHMRLDLKTITISPLKIGDSYEVGTHPAPSITTTVTLTPRATAAVHDAKDGDLRSVRHQHRRLPGHSAASVHG